MKAPGSAVAVTRDVEQPAKAERYSRVVSAMLADPLRVHPSRLCGSADVAFDLICCSHVVTTCPLVQKVTSGTSVTREARGQRAEAAPLLQCE